MLSAPKTPEINHRTIKLLVGLIALFLGLLVRVFANTSLESISAAYHADGLARDVFVGFIFAIAAFLLAYNGKTKFEKILSRIASVAAAGVAIFPCDCGSQQGGGFNPHGTAAAVLFLILAWFCYIFFRRARSKGHSEAMRRATLYALSGLTIVASILLIAIDSFSGGVISTTIDNLTFYSEVAALVAFGVSWLTASLVLPGITNKDERHSLR